MGKKEKNSIARNIFHLFYSTAVSSALNATALITLAYYLQSFHYGMFSVSLAFAMIMGYFTDAGLSEIVLREGSKKVDTSILISSYIKMRTGLLAATFLIGFIVIQLLYADHIQLVQIAYCLIIPMVTGIAMQSVGITFFQLKEKMQFVGLIRIVSAGCLVITIVLGMLLNFQPVLVCFLYGASYFAAGALAIYLVAKNVPIRWKTPFHKGLLQNLGSFTIGGLLFVMLPHLGPLILEKTINFTGVGLFAVAYRIPQALQQVPFIVAGAYYPVLFKAFNSNRLRDHLKYNLTLIKLMALVGMTMTIPFFYLSEFIIKLLFGAEWLAAALPLKILSLMLTLQAINIALADGLTTKSLQIFRTSVQAVSIIIGIFLYVYLSKSFGVTGAAVAGVTIEAVSLIGFWACNPDRWVLAKKVIVPYTLFLTLSFLSINYLLHSVPMLAAVCHLIILVLVLILDPELNKKGKTILKKFKVSRKLSQRAKEAENGL
ncbi:oligosaccharide flippase family protein [Halobacillus salinarum]|uniref:Oligosaccharide flippase family protein n=1 Tax=Halobacillus salinarum TaxID=2932257 RepID=A0ABY4ELT5_9BACI|nr:oligosaccharide flippase family protein [Halobacillus salinarum]UOQ45415.1 oligosaccharide flippase family protein [Halobacillus salinarum]